MAVVHSITSFATGGLDGVQAGQRDWSPYVVHFTSYGAMRFVRGWAKRRGTPKGLSRHLSAADRRSFQMVRLIARSGKLIAHPPSKKTPILPSVCLSECNLPGLIGHSERYGRFGFVFLKSELFRYGGRPCLYVDRQHYATLKALALASDPSLVNSACRERRLHSLANTVSPVRAPDGGIQDYSHEREWRVFSDIDFKVLPPVLMLAPSALIGQVQDLMPGVPVIPLDVLFDWGA